jgi:rRNA maturation endonuclease Nob1
MTANLTLRIVDGTDAVLHEQLIAVAPAYWCTACDEEIDDPEPGYECASCGEQFVRSNSSDGESNRCPTCNKFGAKIADVVCPSCFEQVDEQEMASCPRCDSLTPVESFVEHYLECTD